MTIETRVWMRMNPSFFDAFVLSERALKREIGVR
jgi:hypothetical protein